MRGIDVSNVNGHVAWGRVASDGIGFAFAKATEGCTFRDSLFTENRQGAAAYGIPFGAYHFARPDRRPSPQGAIAEARAFCGVIGKVAQYELRPVLDLESGGGDLTVWAGAFLSEVERLTGVRPLLYTYTAFAKQHLRFSALPGYSVWIADYGRNDGTEHPASFFPFVAHQFTSRGRVSGVSGNVDLNSTASVDPLRAYPRPAPKPKVRQKLWPVPIPAWFWTWAQWRLDGQNYQRPFDAPKVIPPWAWRRLRALK